MATASAARRRRRAAVVGTRRGRGGRGRRGGGRRRRRGRLLRLGRRRLGGLRLGRGRLRLRLRDRRRRLHAVLLGAQLEVGGALLQALAQARVGVVGQARHLVLQAQREVGGLLALVGVDGIAQVVELALQLVGPRGGQEVRVVRGAAGDEQRARGPQDEGQHV